MTTGLLETMARADLDALVTAVGRDYRPGSADRLAALDAAWWAALERAEREVGVLYGQLRDADGILQRWRDAVGELYRLWMRVHEAAAEPEAVLDEVA
ncbi:MAG TPA: hypothetical protein VFC42_07765 [Methylomirabilota bacterium]|jgi:hypothetical protein|nr:hypothetical protein [Methylomirabilota bacterium]